MAESSDPEVPETHVLAIASHVTSGYVGNTMATFCMQTLGCEVSAIHTVNYSNHVAYRRFTGTKTSPSDLIDLYTGLKAARLDSFDMMLSGYCPSAALVEEVGKIGREQKLKSTTKPGTFFWVLDPVMGDNGRVYVSEECVPVYRRIVRDADLVLPNQFEAELLSEVEIRDWESLGRAIRRLHKELGVPNVVVTSVKLPSTPGAGQKEDREGGQKLSVIGSTATSDGTPRLFRITVPALPVFFSGTGDMFAALLVARLREAAQAANTLSSPSWRPEDSVLAADLPLAKATEKVLASMHAVLKDTERHYESVKKAIEEEGELNAGKGEQADKEKETERHLRLTRAAEVRVVRNAKVLREPPKLQDFQAEAITLEHDAEDAEDKVDELGVLKVSAGQGALHQT